MTKHPITKQVRNHRMVISSCIITVMICFYVFSVGLVAVIERCTCDGGRLNWLPSVPGVMTALTIYEWPADLTSKLPVVRKSFEMSADFWWALLDPPDTTP
jgi:hypothetical protein